MSWKMPDDGLDRAGKNSLFSGLKDRLPPVENQVNLAVQADGSRPADPRTVPQPLLCAEIETAPPRLPS